MYKISANRYTNPTLIRYPSGVFVTSNAVATNNANKQHVNAAMLPNATPVNFWTLFKFLSLVLAFLLLLDDNDLVLLEVLKREMVF